MASLWQNTARNQESRFRFVTCHRRRPPVWRDADDVSIKWLLFRHITFLLHTMHDHLSDDEMKELCSLLESTAKQCTGSPRSPKSPKETDGQKIDALDMALIPLTKMPLVRWAKMNNFWAASMRLSISTWLVNLVGHAYCTARQTHKFVWIEIFALYLNPEK